MTVGARRALGRETGDRSKSWSRDNGDPRRPGTVTANSAVDARLVPGASVIQDGGRGAGAAGSSVVVVNTDVDTLPFPPPKIAS